MQHLSEKTQFPDFFFPRQRRSISQVRWENKRFDWLLSPQHFCQKLLQSNRACKDYSKSKVGRFFETQCIQSIIFVSYHHSVYINVSVQTAQMDENHAGQGDESSKIWSGDADENCPLEFTKYSSGFIKTRHFKRRKISGEGLSPPQTLLPVDQIHRPNQALWIRLCVRPEFQKTPVIVHQWRSQRAFRRLSESIFRGPRRSPKRHDEEKNWSTKLNSLKEKLAATLRWFTAGGAIRIAVRQLSQTWKLRH